MPKEGTQSPKPPPKEIPGRLATTGPGRSKVNSPEANPWPRKKGTGQRKKNSEGTLRPPARNPVPGGPFVRTPRKGAWKERLAKLVPPLRHPSRPRGFRHQAAGKDFETVRSQSKSNSRRRTVHSLAPYLVSSKSKGQDFNRWPGYRTGRTETVLGCQLERLPRPRAPAPASGLKPKSKSISTPASRPVAAPYPFHKRLVNGTLPYCDL